MAVIVYTVAVVSSCCRQRSYAKMIITFMLLNKNVLSDRRSFPHRVKYKGFATRSVCFGLLNTCISGVLECRIRSKFVFLRESQNWVVYALPKYYYINSYSN